MFTELLPGPSPSPSRPSKRRTRLLTMERLENRHLMTTFVYQETPHMTGDEVALLEEINDFREVEEGVQPLVPNAALVRAAQDHAQAMADDRLDCGTDNCHTAGGMTDVQRARSEGYPAADNLCENAASTWAAERVFHLWDDSPVHHNNMKWGNLRDVGLGIRENSGTFYASGLFGERDYEHGWDETNVLVYGAFYKDGRVINNNSYDVGEGLGGFEVEFKNVDTDTVYYTRTNDAGLFVLELEAGDYSSYCYGIVSSEYGGSANFGAESPVLHYESENLRLGWRIEEWLDGAGDTGGHGAAPAGRSPMRPMDYAMMAYWPVMVDRTAPDVPDLPKEMEFHLDPIVPPEPSPLPYNPTKPIAAKELNRDFSSSTQRDLAKISADRESRAHDRLFAEYGINENPRWDQPFAPKKGL